MDDLIRAQVRAGDFDRYLCAQFAPPAARPALLALLAFALEVGQVRARTTREPMMGAIRFAWWREGLDAIYGGGRVPPEPVLTALAAAVHAHGLARTHLSAVLDATEDEGEATDLAAFRAICAGIGAGPLRSWLEILGATDGESAAAAQDAGTAWALVRSAAVHNALQGELLAAAAEHIAAGRARRGRVAAAALPALLPLTLAARSVSKLKREKQDGRVQRQLSLLGHALLGRY